jgi:hypothetical protein
MRETGERELRLVAMPQLHSRPAELDDLLAYVWSPNSRRQQ